MTYFAKSIPDVLSELEVDASIGLSQQEVAERQDKYGPNRLIAKKKKSILQLFIAQLQDWLIYVLFVAVVITLFMAEYVDAGIILIVIILNAVLGVVQEIKAGNAIEALQKIASPKAIVKRDGSIKEVDSETLVPGDILILDTGRFIAADIRLIESANLQVEESSLTGESVPSNKDAKQVHETDTSLGDRNNSAFMSTLVTYGRGAGVVTATSMNTEVGKIAGIIGNEQASKTPLEVKLDKLGKTLGLLAIGICVFIFIVAWFQGRGLLEMFLTSVSLAVASIPEGLAAIVAVVLSIGVTGMSKRNAIIRQLPAVETLGSVNVICSDKTGTLTQNKMTVTKCYTPDGEIDIAAPEVGSVAKTVGLKTQAEDGDNYQMQAMLAKAMVLCSDATFENGAGTGDPTEIALLVLADTLGLDRKHLASDFKRIGEVAFDSDRKLMSTLMEEQGQYTVYTKGAIGNLLKKCTHVLQNGEVMPITEAHKTACLHAADRMSNNALRTLGAAYKRVDEPVEGEEMENNLVLLGMVGMIDPPRPEVIAAVKKAKVAGITCVMITGDHKNTAFAIAHELGIAAHIKEAITSKELNSLTEEEFIANVEKYHVFARVSPEDKVRIVRALKSHGHIVSMTGDGVNDAPSLNAADIGVAMGITGTDVAKGAADMILTDDNFSTIIVAIEQGRNIYNNIKKSVIFLLTCNLGEVITMFVTLSIGWESPLIATQLLWINLITDSLPAVALGMDPGDPDVMKEKPRKKNEGFFAGGSGWNVMIGGLLIGLLTVFAFWYGYFEHNASPFDHEVSTEIVEYARTMAFMVLVASQLFYALAVRSNKKSIFQIGLFSNMYLFGAIILGLALQLLVISIPFMQDAFKLRMLDFKGWVAVLILGLVPLVLTELQKIFIRLRERRDA
jgi:Ca2+-transporting ATPase